jgi:Ca2+/Na+ antiporter
MNIELLALYKTSVFFVSVAAFLFAIYLLISALTDGRYAILKAIGGVLILITIAYTIVLTELNRQKGYCEEGINYYCERLQ